MVTLTALPKHRPADALISCVIPAYNEAAHLAAFLHDLRKTLESFAARYEIIVVNDGSKDNTDEVMAPLLKDAGLRYISFSRNFGKEAALSAGIDAAREPVDGFAQNAVDRRAQTLCGNPGDPHFEHERRSLSLRLEREAEPRDDRQRL